MLAITLVSTPTTFEVLHLRRGSYSRHCSSWSGAELTRIDESRIHSLFRLTVNTLMSWWDSLLEIGPYSHRSRYFMCKSTLGFLGHTLVVLAG
ncbi:hypothetical protein BDR03DRAFT_210299 [Suillus americanus]|nr:hypothetical protein BDR03DRAFT_210299 [Suillus americanus]